MSSKSTLILTNDNEHWYFDCNQPVYKNGQYLGDTLTIEFNKENFKVISNDIDGLIIEIDPGSHLYDILNKIPKDLE